MIGSNLTALARLNVLLTVKPRPFEWARTGQCLSLLLAVGCVMLALGCSVGGSDGASSLPLGLAFAGASPVAAEKGVPSNNWSLKGNLNSDADVDYVGTADDVDLVLRTNAQERLRIGATGKILIGGDLCVGGSLDVEGLTRLNNTTESTATTNGALVVAGGMGVAKQLNVGGATNLSSTLTVNGESTINNRLSVVHSATGSSHIAEFRNTSDGNGILIKVGNNDPGTGNNFISFAGSGGGIAGRIEGQTESELTSSFRFIWDEVMAGLDVAFIAAEGTACGTQADLAEVGVMAGSGAVKAAQWAELTIEALANDGVAYESGSGDYAEWLEKADPMEVFSSGDIVGVRAGKISKDTDGAENCLVISKSPIVLGNMPSEDRQLDFEKVSFMGQVPVKVAGSVNKGDYILPSGRNDGFAIAVNPADMTLPDYEQIVGVAWEASVAANGLSYINTAVGINTNDLVPRMIKQQEEINSVKRNMNAIVSYLQSKDRSFQLATFDVAAAAHVAPVRSVTAMTGAERRTSVAASLRNDPAVLESIMADARELLTARGVDFNRFEQTKRLLTDTEYLIDILEGRPGRK